MDVTGKSLSEQEMDAILVRSLARLGAHAPSRGFESRVMSRVALPQPRAVVLYRRARAWASHPSHALALAGAYAVSAVVALVVVVPWLLVRLPAIGFVADWTATKVMGLVRDGVVAVAEWSLSSGLTDAVRSLPLDSAGLWLAGIAVALGYAGCAVGLHFLLRAPKTREAVHVRA
jgi:hypothetical protein